MNDHDWADVTSYARGEERTPRTFEMCRGGLRVVVTRSLYLGPDEWGYWTKPGLPGGPGPGSMPWRLGAEGVEDAKEQAENIVKLTLAAMAGAWGILGAG